MKIINPQVIKKHLTVILIVAAVLLLTGGVLAFQRISAQKQAEADAQPVEEVDLSFDAAGLYALLTPRNDGNALVLNLKRTASYDKISYELAYNDEEGVERGVMGDINTKDKKGEYEQEILFGTCSRNVCKYDKGVENGTLTLHIRKGREAYRMITQWHLQKPELASGVLTSGDSHFTYKIDSKSPDLSEVKFTIINDLSGAPKLPNEKTVTGKVYALNTVVAQNLAKGAVTIELSETPIEGSKIARYDEAQNKWIEYETEIADGKLTASLDGSGVVAVLSPKKS
jgi:hypothetical protein